MTTILETVTPAQPTSTELNAAAQYAGLAEQVKELQNALQVEKRKFRVFAQQQADAFDMQVQRQVDEEHDKQEAIAKDTAERAKPNYDRPASYAEWAGLPIAEKSRLIGLYGEAMVAELMDKKRVLDAAIRADEHQRLLAKHGRR